MSSASANDSSFRLRIVDDLEEVHPSAWNDLGVVKHPFLRHEFLSALERQDSVGERYGWLPRHLTLWDADNRLVGAAPMYLKTNSYGEFVFDWAWADAYERHGLRYYPKLVSASPYTPATGPKLLALQGLESEVRPQLIEAGMTLAQDSGVSSLHWLFTQPDENDLLEQAGLLRRTGCQFHWQNAGYADFDEFLSTLTSAKRKNIRKERRRVGEAGVTFRLLDGNSASESDWYDYHVLYESTFHRRGGLPTLSLAFFREIAERMPEAVLLVQARHSDKTVAAAFCLVGPDTLYGRHWGCNAYFDNLHFEACYYQGLDFCIERGLQRFEPGAQGEHKIARGFLPTETLSAHWLADARFAEAIGRHLEHERAGVSDYMAELASRSPYRAST